MKLNTHYKILVILTIIFVLIALMPEVFSSGGTCTTTTCKPGCMARGCCCTNCGFHCFAAGTQISMADGTTKNIEDIETGDIVFSYDVNNDEQVAVEVGGLWTGPHDDMYIINGNIHVTSEHPFWTVEAGWAALNPAVTMDVHGWKPSNLVLGYHFLDIDSNLVEVVSVEENFGEVLTYNLINVGKFSTYYAEGVLVHNKGEPPPPPPICGDGTWQALTDKACEYTANPVIFSNNGQYTGNVCETNDQSCRNDCTCCGDSIKQGKELCDLGTNNGQDLNSDGYIGVGECRVECTFCGDGIIQSDEECDDGNTNNFDNCRNDCSLPYCGDGILDQGEFCDFEIECPSKGCYWDNYNEWKDSGYYPGCRNDCSACGDGILQLEHNEGCDDTREYDDQRHSSFDTEQHKNTCPGACVQPEFISSDVNECTCPIEICNQIDDDKNCEHCSSVKSDAQYYSDLCFASTTPDTSLWNIIVDRNENGIDCDCCLFGEAGCCDDINSNICISAGKVSGQYICDDGVDEGFSWPYTRKNIELSSAFLTPFDFEPMNVVGIQVSSELKVCSDMNSIVSGDYIYLTYEDIVDEILSDTVPGTNLPGEYIFTIRYKNFGEKLSVEWYDYVNYQWLGILSCQNLESDIVVSSDCKLPQTLMDQIDNGLIDKDKPILRIVIT